MATGRPAGRPAKPAELHRVLGNPGHRSLPVAPLPGDGVEGVSTVPNAPAHLGDAGVGMWEHVWQAGRQWLAPEADASLVLLLCEAFDDYCEIRDQITSGKVERIYMTSNGSLVTHPFVGQLKDLRVQMTSWLSALGFSPADRARLGLAEVRVRDELDDLQKRRNERASGSI